MKRTWGQFWETVERCAGIYSVIEAWLNLSVTCIFIYTYIFMQIKLWLLPLSSWHVIINSESLQPPIVKNYINVKIHFKFQLIVNNTAASWCSIICFFLYRLLFDYPINSQNTGCNRGKTPTLCNTLLYTKQSLKAIVVLVWCKEGSTPPNTGVVR